MELISVIVLICNVEAGEIIRETCDVQSPRLWFSSMEQCDNNAYKMTVSYLAELNDPSLRVEHYCHDWRPEQRQNEAL